ncbi:MAG: RpiB/LacA/LacB family sugar-phosphate isomerase [Candidatus Saccharibacteria bacterium]|nr:RpiB/LacA/LacB family sugar-phosphate isomerase [Candidatus Saccharibacteria bacterium]
MPRLFLGADHRGFSEKQRLLNLLNQTNLTQQYEIVDLGPATLKPEDDFNDAAIAVARAVRETPGSRGILICGSAHGVSIQANRFRGVRAICGYTAELVRLGRLHNDANILCLSTDFMDINTINQAVSMFFSGEFLPEERYIRRNRRLDEEDIYA